MKYMLRPRKTISCLQYDGTNQDAIDDFTGGRTKPFVMDPDNPVEVLILRDKFGYRVIEPTNWACEQMTEQEHDELVIVPNEHFQTMFQPVP